MVALLVQALHQSCLITFIIIFFSFLTLFIIIIITIITVTFLFPLSMPLNSQILILGEHLSEQKSPGSAKLTLASKDHLCEQGPLAVRLEVEQLLAVLQLFLKHAPRHLHSGQDGGLVMLERTTSTSITTITILQLLLLHTLGYLATGRDAN